VRCHRLIGVRRCRRQCGVATALLACVAAVASAASPPPYWRALLPSPVRRRHGLIGGRRCRRQCGVATALLACVAAVASAASPRPYWRASLPSPVRRRHSLIGVRRCRRQCGVAAQCVGRPGAPRHVTRPPPLPVRSHRDSHAPRHVTTGAGPRRHARQRGAPRRTGPTPRTCARRPSSGPTPQNGRMGGGCPKRLHADAARLRRLCGRISASTAAHSGDALAQSTPCDGPEPWMSWRRSRGWRQARQMERGEGGGRDKWRGKHLAGTVKTVPRTLRVDTHFAAHFACCARAAYSRAREGVGRRPPSLVPRVCPVPHLVCALCHTSCMPCAP
jgi:hypothetical protein